MCYRLIDQTEDSEVQMIMNLNNGRIVVFTLIYNIIVGYIEKVLPSDETAKLNKLAENIKKITCLIKPCQLKSLEEDMLVAKECSEASLFNAGILFSKNHHKKELRKNLLSCFSVILEHSE